MEQASNLPQTQSNTYGLGENIRRGVYHWLENFT